MTIRVQATYSASEGALVSCVASHFITTTSHESSASLFTSCEALAAPPSRRAQCGREPREHGRTARHGHQAHHARRARRHADGCASRISPDDPRDQSSDGVRRLGSRVVRLHQQTAHRGRALPQRMNFTTCGLLREHPARIPRTASDLIGRFRFMAIALRPQVGGCVGASGRWRSA